MWISFLLIFLVPIANCVDLPNLLLCVDDKCSETISSGRLQENAKTVFGELKSLKKNGKVNVKGKNVLHSETLWLIESDGLLGFIDYSFIKEFKNGRTDLENVPNPFVDKTNINKETDNKSQRIFSKDDDDDDDETESAAEVKDDMDNLDKKTSDVLKADTDNFKEQQAPSKTKDAKLLPPTEGTVLPGLKNDSMVSVNNTINKQSDDNKQNSETKIKLDKLNLSEVGKESDTQSKLTSVVNDSVTTELKSADAVRPTEENPLKNLNVLKNEMKQVDLKTKKSVEENIQENTDELINTNKEHNSGALPVSISTKESEEGSSLSEKIDIVQTLNETESKIVEKTIRPKVPEMQVKQSQSNDKSYDKELLVNASVELPNTIESHQKISPENEDIINESKDKVPPQDQVTKPPSIHTQFQLPGDKETTQRDSLEINKQFEIETHSKVKIEAARPDPNLKRKSESIKADLKFPKMDEFKSEERLEVKDSRNIGYNDNLYNAMNKVKETKIRSEVPPEVEVPKSFNSLSNERERDESLKQDDMQLRKTESEMKEKEMNFPKSTIETITSIKLDSDPWLTSIDENQLNQTDINIKSPTFRLLIKFDQWIHSFIRQKVLSKFNMESSNIFLVFLHNWLNLPIETFVLLSTICLLLFSIIYIPKLLGFNRNWKREFDKQLVVIGELQMKIKGIDEVRQKLTVQNHNFERVIDGYKKKIAEIQDDAEKNSQKLLSELEMLQKTNDSATRELDGKLQMKDIELEKMGKELKSFRELLDIGSKEKSEVKEKLEKERMHFENSIEMVQNELQRYKEVNDALKELSQKTEETNMELLNRIDSYSEELSKWQLQYRTLEKSFNEMKSMDGLSEEEQKEKIEQQLELTKLRELLDDKNEELDRLQYSISNWKRELDEMQKNYQEMVLEKDRFELDRQESVKQKEDAEKRLEVLTEYFQKKEVEMQKSLGFQVVENTQSLDHMDRLKLQNENLETENKSLLAMVEKFKQDARLQQDSFNRLRMDTNEQVQGLHLDRQRLIRELDQERVENQRLRSKLSHYCGPQPNIRTAAPPNFSNNHNNFSFSSSNERPPSRHSGGSEASNSVSSFPYIPIDRLPKSNQSQFSGRNSVNSSSKRSSNNTNTNS